MCSLGESLAELYHGNAVSSQFGNAAKNLRVLYIPAVVFILGHFCPCLILLQSQWLVHILNHSHL